MNRVNCGTVVRWGWLMGSAVCRQFIQFKRYCGTSTPVNDSHAGDDTNSQEPVIDSSQSAAAIPTSSPLPLNPITCATSVDARRDWVALVPCGHSRFRSSCADTVADMAKGCTICRTPIMTEFCACSGDMTDTIDYILTLHTDDC